MNFIAVNEPLFQGNEKKYLNECIDTGWISSEGRFVHLLEEQIAKYTNRTYGVAVTNGTAALEVAARALGLGLDDEVIIPTFTIISCVQAIVGVGAKPVFVDCDDMTFNMKIDDIESKITAKTKAIMVVHLYGLPVDMNPVLVLAEKYGLKIIEDAAQAIGQTYYGKPCGSFGDVSTFSFYPNKNITTGEGGMIVTNDEAVFQKCQSLRNLCFSVDSAKRFIHEELGWNLRMTNLQAAVGVAQFENIDKHIAKKRWIGEQYQEKLMDIKNVQLPLVKTEYADNLYWVFTIVLNDDIDKSAQEVMKELAVQGIGTRPFFYPIHLQPILQKMGLSDNQSYTNAERLYQKGFYIPSGLGINQSQIDKVSQILHEVLK